MPLSTLAGQAVAMFVLSFAVGYLPLVFRKLQQGKPLKIVSMFGMGLLVGSALTVIIPEGIDTLYDALPTKRPSSGDDTKNPSHAIGIALISGFALMMLVENLTPHPGESESNDEEDGVTFDADDEDLDSEEHDHEQHRLARSSFNGSTASGGGSGNSHSHAPAGQGARMDSSSVLFPKKSQDPEACSTIERVRRRIMPSRGGKGFLKGLNATLGLIIHAMADGIALGASSLTENSGLGLVVFLAVIIHKGPTALGLTTTLMTLKLNRQQIQTRLLLFSASAPAGALLTYGIVNLFGGRGVSELASSAHKVDQLGWWTGLVLLFSGGSFLYVATVISPLSSSETHDTHAHAHEHDPESERLSQTQRLGLLLIGMVLPLALSMVIGDEH